MAFSGALVKKAVDQTTANFTAAFTALTWDTETYDVGGWHDTGSNTSRLTVPSGVTHVKLTGCVGISSITGTASLYLAVFKNGDAVAGTRSVNLPVVGPLVMANGDYQLPLVSGPLAVTPGDYFELVVFIVGDSSVTVTAGQSFFAIEAIENFSGAMAKKAADQTAANYSANAVITWDTDALDVGGWHDTGSNTSRLTAATRHVNLPVMLQDSGGTEAYINLVSGPLAVSAGDYFEVRLLTSGDASVTVEDHSWFAIEKLA
jgi:hypothetical protein